MTLNSCRDPVKSLLSSVRWPGMGNITMIKYEYKVTNTNIGTQNTNTKAHIRKQIQKRCRDPVKLLLSSVRWLRLGNCCKLTMHSFVKLHFGWIAFERDNWGRVCSPHIFGFVYCVHIKSPQGTKNDQTITVKPLH